MNNEEYLHYLGRHQYLVTYADEKKYVERDDEDNEYRFNIVSKKDGQMIGNCDIFAYPYNRTASLGIVIGEKEYRGIGIGSEVIKLLVRFCFEELNTHTVSLHLDSRNEIAYKCYTKAGFKECGREKECHFHAGEYSDNITMQILEQDYYSSKIDNLH